jgi:hypothetical protein
MLVMIFLVVISFGCGNDNKRAIIGKWEGVEGIEGKEILEFLKDGNMNITKIGDLGIKVGGVYWFIDDDRISIVGSIRLADDSAPPDPGTPIVYSVSVSENELILTSSDGRIAKYRRR